MALKRFYYSNSIQEFFEAEPEYVLGCLTKASEFSAELPQRDAWLEEIAILKDSLSGLDGRIYFEYSIPRMGRRIDIVVIVASVLFVLEFKVGASQVERGALDQVWDYSLDLKNFHETSHGILIAPILVATLGKQMPNLAPAKLHSDLLYEPTAVNSAQLRPLIDAVIETAQTDPINADEWELGRYKPTPTIVEAAMALYRDHSVVEITRSDAAARNLSETSSAIESIIRDARINSRKSICFVTGVPGAGKTLVGLNIATTHMDKTSELYSVFLSGNGPLVAVLREALTRDRVLREKELRRTLRKGEAFSEVKTFIQNIHHFRDACLIDPVTPPIDHVALFDEAQRAWDLAQTASFMKRKKSKPGFDRSEPDFLISCLDRHRDWAVIVCLVGGGQEINTGEAGIAEWLRALGDRYPHWKIFVSPQLTDSEYRAEGMLNLLSSKIQVEFREELHLSVSVRSFRAENVSLFVKQILDSEADAARKTLQRIGEYPILLTRDMSKARAWLRSNARGSERFGIVVSSQAERLRPYAIHVKAPMDPIHWFLGSKEDTRSSYYLEDVATEFHIQGLELDWTCVAWDADFRRTHSGWDHWSFCGDRWNRIRKESRKSYQKNAYRVLLTRARQGMVLVVPEGSGQDPTRSPEFYDGTFKYLQNIGIPELD